MKTSSMIAAAALVLAAAGGAPSAHADTADADCQVRKKGDLAKDASGPCTFSQRQGYIDITLKNGGTYNLSPGERANHFKDQNGHGVERTAAGGDSHTYKWDNMQIVVTFGGAPAAAGGGGGDRIAVDDMPKYCAGEASAKFGQSPRDITTQKAAKDHGMYSVWGQYPAEPSPQVFICTFSAEGRFVGVDKHQP